MLQGLDPQTRFHVSCLSALPKGALHFDQTAPADHSPNTVDKRRLVVAEPTPYPSVPTRGFYCRPQPRQRSQFWCRSRNPSTYVDSLRSIPMSSVTDCLTGGRCTCTVQRCGSGTLTACRADYKDVLVPCQYMSRSVIYFESCTREHSRLSAITGPEMRRHSRSWEHNNMLWRLGNATLDGRLFSLVDL